MSEEWLEMVADLYARYAMLWMALATGDKPQEIKRPPELPPLDKDEALRVVIEVAKLDERPSQPAKGKSV